MKYLISIILVLTGIVLVSQTSIDTSKNYFLDEVIITAQYAPQKINDSVYKLSIIDAEEIRTRGATNLRELLYHELNIDLEQRSVFGTSAEIQGISKENVKILLDGVPLIGRLNGIIDLTQISLDNIERVEIIEGPTSVFYGTDAMAGTINLISKQKQKNRVEGNVVSNYESVGAMKISAGLGYMKGNSRMQLSGGHYSFGGYSPILGEIRNRQWESRDQNFGKLQFAQWFNTMKLSYSGDAFSEKLIKLGEKDVSNLAKDINYRTRRINNRMDLRGSLSEDSYLSVTASYSDYLRYHNSYFTNLDTEVQSLSPKEIDHDTTRYHLTYIKGQISNKQQEASVKYFLGSELNFETTNGNRILDGSQKIQSYAVFTSANFILWEHLSLQPGLRYTYNNIYGKLLTPAFNLKLDFGKNSRILVSYARGFRAPSLKELYLDFYFPAGPFTYHIIGNQELKAEQSHNFNLSLYSQLNLGKRHLLILEPSFFYNNITNLIALSAIVDYKRNYINVNSHKTHGGKIVVSYKPTQQFSVKTGFAITGRYNSFSEEKSADLQNFLYTTDFRSETTYNVVKKDLSFSLYYKFNGERSAYALERGTGELIETVIDHYSIFDFTLSKFLLNKQLVLNAGVKNILDVKNLDTIRAKTGEAHATSSFLWGRTFFTRLEWRF